MTEINNFIIEEIKERLGRDIVRIDFENSPITDTFIIATGNVVSHNKSIANAIELSLEEAGYELKGLEGYRDGSWILLDYGDTIVHLFLKDTREYYDLENLWKEEKITKLED